MNAGKACLFCGRVLPLKRVKHGGRIIEMSEYYEGETS
jgi:hypothetical protein